MQTPNSAPGAPDRGGPATPDADASATPNADASDEFSVIARLRARFEAAPGGAPAPGDLGIGDDAALLALPPGPAVFATDLVVEGVHVDLDVSSPADVGWKALMVTVSDLAAMGAEARAVLLSVAAPAGFPLDDLADGVAQAASAAGCAVVGGDLSAAPLLVVSVAAVGWVPDDGGAPALRRSGARAGDALVVTGPLGASAAGLRLARRGSADSGGPLDPQDEALVAAHRRPAARLAEGRAARRGGARAAVDLSDGLVADAVHLAEASGVGLDLVACDGLVAPGATLDEALGGGEDYELLCATPDPDALIGAFRAAGLRPPLVVGRCTAEPSRRTLGGGPLPGTGWRHRF